MIVIVTMKSLVHLQGFKCFVCAVLGAFRRRC